MKRTLLAFRLSLGFFIGGLVLSGFAWVLRCGLVACGAVIPLALICGHVRHIPLEWRLLDCSFGILGTIPLFYCLHLTKKLSGRG